MEPHYFSLTFYYVIIEKRKSVASLAKWANTYLVNIGSDEHVPVERDYFDFPTTPESSSMLKTTVRINRESSVAPASKHINDRLMRLLANNASLGGSVSSKIVHGITTGSETCSGCAKFHDCNDAFVKYGVGCDEFQRA